MTAGRICEKCGRETKGRKLCDTCRSREFRQKNPTYHRDHMRKSTPEQKAAWAESWQARAARNVAAVDAARAVPCADCGGTFPLVCMDLDHVPERGPKLYNLSDVGGRKLENVLAEIAKCDAVCSNCHRTRTKGRAKGTGMH